MSNMKMEPGTAENPQGGEPDASPVAGNKRESVLTAEEIEELRKRIFELKTNGMSYLKIAKIVEKHESTVRYHYKQARLERIREIETEGWKPKASEIIRKNEKLYEIAMLHLSHLTTQREEAPELDGKGKVIKKGRKGGLGSVAAAIWTQTVMKLVKQDYEFLMEIGILPRASEKLDITIQDAKSMSLEELQVEALRLKRQLAGADIVADEGKKLLAQNTLLSHQGQNPGLKQIDGKVTRVIEKAIEEVNEKLGLEGLNT